MHELIEQRLAQQLDSPLARRRVVLQSPQGASISINGKKYLSFAANDYLGLANDPRVVSALQQGAQRWGVGSGSADLVTGHSQPHHDLEQALAAATGRERALLFSSGFQANLAVISTFATAGDTVLQDRLNHASLLDGCRLAGARLRRYLHADTGSLQRLLEKTPGNGMAVTDAVFSMDGTIAPLAEICNLMGQHPRMLLMVDDAHGFGVLGEQGAGTLCALGIDAHKVPLLMCTLGKALGTSGAFVAGSNAMIESLLQFARPYIYSTSSSPAMACATMASLQIMQQEQWRRDHLQELIRIFREGVSALDLQLVPSGTPIQPVIVGDSEQALRLSERLREHGIWVTAIRPPTVARGTARLRFTLSAAHSQAGVRQLVRALAAVVRENKHD